MMKKIWDLIKDPGGKLPPVYRKESSMDKLKCWMEKNKQLCVLTGIIGMFLASFLWPFFLAIIFNSLTLAVPVILVYLLIKQPWKEKKNIDENNECNEQGKKPQNVYADRKKCESVPHEADPETDNLSKGEQEKGQEPVKCKEGKDVKAEKNTQTNRILSWYRMEGRERILRLKRKLSQEGIHEFSVSKEGICTVREDKRFRRIGVIKSFPQQEIFRIERELRADGIQMRMIGKYLWLFWGKEAHH